MIQRGDGLRTIAFKLCTHLASGGVSAVVTGGSAATIYVPERYQSRDIDIITFSMPNAVVFRELMSEFGFTERNRQWFLETSPVTLEVVGQDILIGNDTVEVYETLEENELFVNVLCATDCVRDRLASFFWYRDISALSVAVAVAESYPVNLDLIKDWARREGESPNFEIFVQRMQSRE